MQNGSAILVFFLAEDRIQKMMKLYNILKGMVNIPRFPPYGRETPDNLNINVLEEILCGIESRLYLYLLTPDSGKSFIF